MRIGLIAFGWAAVLAMASLVSAQTHPLRESAEPDQPVRPQVPTLVPRQPASTQAAASAPKSPFTLSPEEQAQVDQALKQWEEHSQGIKTFDCRFRRWIYDVVFGPPGRARFDELGSLRYQAPDRGVFRVETAMKDNKEVPIDDVRAERWICDGKSIFEYRATQKQLIEHKLPPELHGKAIANSPLPFLFGAESQRLKDRYWIRIVTPPGVTDQIWLEAYPRFQQDAANFHHAEFVIKKDKMAPFALKLVQPNEKDSIVYQFYDIEVNDPFRLFKGDPFRAFTPIGWQKIVEQPPTSPAEQARRSPENSR